ncbi:hypothetical protein TYRP_012175 [Tyrophagus putrescentiae]|nr:hypothetical protein TYRP_012175 [Tyrophagus putrescentiae]
MSFNHVHYLHHRWLADQEIRGSVLWREYMSQHGEKHPITIDTVRRLLRQFKTEKKTNVKAICSLQRDFGEDNFSRFMISRWYKRFQKGDYSCQDKKAPGHSKNTEDEQLKGVLALNPFATPEEIALNLDITKRTVYRRMKNLGYTLKLSRWVPHLLTPLQKQKRPMYLHTLPTTSYYTHPPPATSY